MNTVFFENWGIGIIGLVIAITFGIIDYLLHREDDNYIFKNSFLKSIVIIIIYLILSVFLYQIPFGKYNKSNWEDTKRLALALSLLVFFYQSYNQPISRTKSLLRGGAVLYAVLIALGFFIPSENYLAFIDIINDVIGIVVVLFTSFIFLVLRRHDTT